MSNHPRFRKRHADHGGSDAGDHAAPARGSRSARGTAGYTLAHAGRQLRLGPIGFWTTVAVLVTMALWSAGTATYFAFRDDLLTGLIARQAEMQYAYEDRIAEMRAQVDRLTSRQLLDQEQVEQRIEQLARRQSTLESRSSALTGGADSAGAAKPAARPWGRGETGPALGPKPSPLGDTKLPGTKLDQQSELDLPFGEASGAQFARAKRAQNLEAALARIEESLDRVEARQGATVSAMGESYEGKARRIRGVLADLGLDVTKLPQGKAAAGIGGPFVPVALRAEGSGFERNLQRIQFARAHLDALTRTLTAVPLRAPLVGDLDTSSSFGVRYDPFTRSPAMHAGHDFRAPTGEPVRATAAGTVISAGWSGGYGRMVEVDHGNGFTTRYGHLSDIHVDENQTVRPGQIVGRVGSTGRSTGPHLHYETRVDGEAVDPLKFLRAGIRLAGDL